MKTTVVVLLLTWVAKTLQGGAHWNYLTDEGWKDVCSTGRAQSPIDVSAAEFVSLPEWQFHGYTVASKGEVQNNGHSFKFTLKGSPPQAGGAGLPGTFTFAQGHFHWGNSSLRGSEHQIGGRPFPLELHLVHFNSKYANIGEAIGHPDGLAVIGIFFSLSPTDNPALAPLLSSLGSVASPSPSSSAFSPAVSLSSLLPKDTSAFYRYSGSLTTPTCNEVVTWTLLHQPVGVSESQLAGLRALLDGDGNTMGDNFRAVQPLYGRKVTANGLGSPLVIKHMRQEEEEGGKPSQRDQWYWSMVPGWAVVLLCLAVAANVAVLVMLAMRRRRVGSDGRGIHQRVPTDEPKAVNGRP